MDLIQKYNSDCEDTLTFTENAVSDLQENQVRSVYLVTYSQADKNRIQTRRQFACALVQSFVHVGAEVKNWCCSEELHKAGGTHYHAAIKLSKIHRWNAAKRVLRDRYGITVNFSNRHHNYYSAWQYVTKSDLQYLESDGHPDLVNTGQPITTCASERLQQRNRSKKQKGLRGKKDGKITKKEKRLTALEVSNILLSKKIKTLTQLQALAYKQRAEGKNDLMQFIIGRSRKTVSELIENTWEIKEANDRIERARKTRLDILNEKSTEICVSGCDGLWLTFALEILHNNNISKQHFATSVKNLLDKGRGKYRNLMITGPANCGKTFILKPLTIIYDTFCNPATGSFAWVGVEEKECIFLNDFRWSSQLIPWHDLLLMLEGESVHLPAPKTHYSKDLLLVKDTPIVCTSKRPLMYTKSGIVDDRETEMMAVRWRLLEFKYQIPETTQRYLSPCGHCFAKLVLDNSL